MTIDAIVVGAPARPAADAWMLVPPGKALKSQAVFFLWVAQKLFFILRTVRSGFLDISIIEDRVDEVERDTRRHNNAHTLATVVVAARISVYCRRRTHS
jgi:hypothetical protein